MNIELNTEEIMEILKEHIENKFDCIANKVSFLDDNGEFYGAKVEING
jgi:hypothetical protein